MSKNIIMVLAPHIDDGELGCGATVAKMLLENKTVYYVAFSSCSESVPDGFPKDILLHEVKKATSILGFSENNIIIKNYPVRHFPEHRQAILEDLVTLSREINPDLVFTPSSFDVHQDHRTIYEESLRAFKNTSILGYEFMWNNYSFGSTLFSVVEENHIFSKIQALREYQSQAQRFYATDRLVRGLANFRGLQIKEEFAEAFEVIRWIMR